MFAAHFVNGGMGATVETRTFVVVTISPFVEESSLFPEEFPGEIVDVSSKNSWFSLPIWQRKKSQGLPGVTLLCPMPPRKAGK